MLLMAFVGNLFGIQNTLLFRGECFVSKPKEDGGLGLKNLGAWNMALIAKTLWKIHLKKDSLWIKWISHVHSHFPNVWLWTWH